MDVAIAGCESGKGDGTAARAKLLELEEEGGGKTTP